jgi:hypothetical protein
VEENPGFSPKTQLLTQYKRGRFTDESAEIKFGQAHKGDKNNRHERNRGRGTDGYCVFIIQIQRDRKEIHVDIND